MNRKLELLAPAKNLKSGIAAINCGADAVYIGYEKFGARKEAGNSLADIERLIEYAHLFRASVYVTINTVLYDSELQEIEELVNELYSLKCDGIIFQDMAFLNMDIPPIALIASTQADNSDIEKIKLFDSLGIKRVILARELSLEKISAIRNSVNLELEFFVHGSLCVSYSGKCYLSNYLGGRSANRGECAQPCRLKYSLVDDDNNIIVKDKYLLSLKDINLSKHIMDLINSGISSFKIEGRLKDTSYVENVVTYYRKIIDEIIENNPGFKRSSSGKSINNFEPDLERTFNRGFTNYFLNSDNQQKSTLHTPKSLGKVLGKVKEKNRNGIKIETEEEIALGDGLCYLDKNNILRGFSVNELLDDYVMTENLHELHIGTIIYRNYDKRFIDKLDKSKITRKIDLSILVSETSNGLNVFIQDEDNISVSKEFAFDKKFLLKDSSSRKILKEGFSKLGNTIFNCIEFKAEVNDELFLKKSHVNDIRRIMVDVLIHIRKEKVIEDFPLNKADKISYRDFIGYEHNVTNKRAEEFYKNLGANYIERGIDLTNNFEGKKLMQTKYCVLNEINHCLKESDRFRNKNLSLINDDVKLNLHFNCTLCEMEIYSENKN